MENTIKKRDELDEMKKRGKNYNDEQLHKATEHVNKGTMTLLQASLKYNVPKETIRRHARNSKESMIDIEL